MIFGNIQYFAIKIKIKQHYEIKRIQHKLWHQNVNENHVYDPVMDEKKYSHILQPILMVIMHQKVAVYDMLMLFGYFKYFVLKIKSKQHDHIKKIQHKLLYQNMHEKHVYYSMMKKKEHLYILQLILMVIIH